MKCQNYYMNYAEGREALLAQQLNMQLEDINSRLNEVEHKVARHGKKPNIQS